MSFEGRSPLKDVVRSVLLGAAMISPVVLTMCKNEGAPPVSPEGPAQTAAADANDAAAAPPTATVRPRLDPNAPQTPTRGFSGAARARA